MGNKGIIISSGQFNAQQVVVGDGARIVNYGERERGLLLDRLEALLIRICCADLSTEQRKSLLNATSVAIEEAKAVEPNKALIENSLSFIEKTVPSITAVANAVTAVKELVSAWIIT